MRFKDYIRSSDPNKSHKRHYVGVDRHGNCYYMPVNSDKNADSHARELGFLYALGPYKDAKAAKIASRYGEVKDRSEPHKYVKRVDDNEIEDEEEFVDLRKTPNKNEDEQGDRGNDELEPKTKNPDDEPDDNNDEDEPEDPNHQGVIRTIDNAHLIFKRKTPDGSYEELWIYKIHDRVSDEMKVRRAILAGTDIPQGKTTSPDRTQQYDLWTVGNVQYLHITGLPD